MRKVGFLLVVLLGAALTVAACTNGDSGGGGGSDGIAIVGTDFAFEPKSIEASVGEEVTFTFKNEGALIHNLVIEEFGVESGLVAAGASAKLTFTPNQAGAFRFICNVPGHEEAGMFGGLTVE